jgi:hypothetical protein
MINKTFTKVELIFWEIFIRTLTNSKFARHLVTYGSGAVQELKRAQTIKMLGVIALVGLICGFVLSYLNFILR